MPSNTQRGQADHRALEIFERCAKVVTDKKAEVYRFEAEITEEIILDAAKRFWTRRGYATPGDNHES